MWKNEADLKNWLAEKLNGYLTEPYSGKILGRIEIKGINGNNERGMSKSFSIPAPTGKRVYPDLVGTIELNGKKKNLYVEAVLYKGFKSLTHSFRQALQYKGDVVDVFSRRPNNIVLITADVLLLDPAKESSLYWFERFVWANGMGIIRRSVYSNNLVITLSEQEKYYVGGGEPHARGNKT